MRRKMLYRRVQLTILGVLPFLQAANESSPHPPCQQGVFPIGFMSASPTRVAEQIDIGGPERKSLINPGLSKRFVLIVLCAGLVRNGLCYVLQ